MRQVLRSLAVVLICWVTPAGALAAWSPKLPVKGVTLEFPDRKTPGAGIAGLEWDSLRFDLSIETVPGSPTPTRARMHLYGTVVSGIAKDYCQLAYPQDQAKIPVNETGSFEFIVSLKGIETNGRLACVTDLGSVTIENVVVKFPGLKRFLFNYAAARVPRFDAHVGLGATSIIYSEITNGFSTDYKSLSATLTGGANYWVKPGRWSVSGAGYVTVTPITRSGLGESSDVRFLGINLRAGWVVPRIRRPWSFTLFGGGYYVTTIVTPRTFGFQNMAGPQLYPRLRYFRRNGDQVSTYVKFSPVAVSLSLLNFSNREMALGVSYVFARKAISINVDASDLGLKFIQPETGESFEMRTRTVSLGVGKSF